MKKLPSYITKEYLQNLQELTNAKLVGVNKAGTHIILVPKTSDWTAIRNKQRLLQSYGLEVDIVGFSHRLAVKIKKPKVKKNPPPHAPVEIYDQILEIRAKKGTKSLWPNQLFKHGFKGSSRAKIYGNPDGSLTIRSINGTRLWKHFDY